MHSEQGRFIVKMQRIDAKVNIVHNSDFLRCLTE